MFTVIYRTGGSERFEWRRVFVGYKTREEARAVASDLERQGYRALVHVTRLLDSIGMPEGFEAGASNA